MRPALHTGDPFVSPPQSVSEERERERKTGRTVVLRIVHGVIRHGRELTATTFHPNHVIDVRNARFFLPYRDIIWRTLLPHIVASSLAEAFVVDRLYRTVTLPDIIGLIVLTEVRHGGIFQSSREIQAFRKTCDSF